MNFDDQDARFGTSDQMSDEKRNEIDDYLHRQFLKSPFSLSILSQIKEREEQLAREKNTATDSE
jgi:hypothetical protein